MMLDHYQQTKNLPGPRLRQGPGVLLMERNAVVAGADHRGRRRVAASAAGAARRVDVPPVRRRLRRLVAECVTSMAQFLVGYRDVLLSILDVGSDGVPVWISGRQFEAWKHTQLVIDVVPGRGAGPASRHPKECGS